MPKITIHDLTEKELIILYREVDDRKKSTAQTWLLWMCLFGAHRLYLGRSKDTGWVLLVTQGILLLYYFYLGGGKVGFFTKVFQEFDWMVPFILGGLVIWRIVDAFLISGMLREDKHQVEGKVLEELAAMRKTQI